MTMDEQKGPSLNIDLHNLSDADYRAVWDNLYRIEIRMVEKIGECK